MSFILTMTEVPPLFWYRTVFFYLDKIQVPFILTMNFPHFSDRAVWFYHGKDQVLFILTMSFLLCSDTELCGFTMTKIKSLLYWQWVISFSLIESSVVLPRQRSSPFYIDNECFPFTLLRAQWFYCDKDLVPFILTMSFILFSDRELDGFTMTKIQSLLHWQWREHLSFL